jgi:hypothetical protein
MRYFHMHCGGEYLNGDPAVYEENEYICDKCEDEGHLCLGRDEEEDRLTPTVIEKLDITICSTYKTESGWKRVIDQTFGAGPRGFDHNPPDEMESFEAQLNV